MKMFAQTPPTARPGVKLSKFRLHATQSTTPLLPSQRLVDAARLLSSCPSGLDRLKTLLTVTAPLPRLPASQCTPNHRVAGCAAQVWLNGQYDAKRNVMHFVADADAAVSRAVAILVADGLSNLDPHTILSLDPSTLAALLHLDAETTALGASTAMRTGGVAHILEACKKRARLALAAMDQVQVPKFPSLLISAHRLEPQGQFAMSQAAFLSPDPALVKRLAATLRSKRIGIVAHFYMDPQVQGVLSSAAAEWPHIHISDSLVMADRAVSMVQQGCERVVVLGVDFMSENVRAILDEAGFNKVPVYRLASDAIGCSLAEAAESKAYETFLRQASETPRSIHVVYINTSLKTKAEAHALVPTITCTSSNVVQTVLTAFAQVPESHVWYGPDTYMGHNLVSLFESLANASSDAMVQALHPAHSRASIRALLPRLHTFEQGQCIVHHLFGGEVCRTVKEYYNDAYITAHFEVPGEMFALAMEAQRTRDMGVVGSTQNILDFISARVKDSLSRPYSDTLRFVLGTETGMITAIVRKVQALLQEDAARDAEGDLSLPTPSPSSVLSRQRRVVEVEIIFPVAPEAITTTAQTTLPGGLAVVPGPAGGEGCSSEGGCASCPYMKMNSLAALERVSDAIGTPAESLVLSAYEPRKYTESIQGMSIAAAGCIPILHMRSFQKQAHFSPALVQDMMERRR